MRHAIILRLFIILSLVLPICRNFGKTPKPSDSLNFERGFPQSYIRRLGAYADRWANPDYYRALMGIDLPRADARGLFATIQRSSDRGQNYKALYLARLFTEAHPEIPAGWANRSSIAVTLGLAKEAAAALARSQGASGADVPLELLPGAGIRLRPRDIQDWAALIALVADGTAARTRATALVGVRDDVSGLWVSTPEEVSRVSQRVGSPVSPWARALAVKMSDVAFNLFCFKDVKPMRESYTNRGALLAGLAMGAAGALSPDVTTSTNAGYASGTLLQQAYSVPSNLKGGQYTKLIYNGDSPSSVTVKPTPSGSHDAIGSPVPLLWATGPARSPVVRGRVFGQGGGDPTVLKVDPQNGANHKARFKRATVPDLAYPKLMALGWNCENNRICHDTTIPLSLFEVMLDTKDVRTLFPSQHFTAFDNSNVEAEYAAGNLTLCIGNLASDEMNSVIGFDSHGVGFLARLYETQWLGPAVN